MKKEEIKNIMAMARKAKYEENLITFSATLRADQVEYLRKLENASEWLRNAIDEKITSETDTEHATTMQLIKIISLKQKELDKITNDEFYQESTKTLRYLKRDIERLKEAKSVYVASRKEWNQGAIYINKNIINCYNQPEIKTLAKTFIAQNDLEFEEDIPKSKIPLLLKKLKQHYNYAKKKKKAMRQEANKLQKEIQQLQEKLNNI